MAAPEAVYYTPDGCVDLPFIYVFDASTLTDGTTPAPLIRPITSDSDADFMLRAILGVPNCIDTAVNGGGFQLYNYSGSAAFSSPYSPFTAHYPVVPEKFFPRFSAIKFLLQQVKRANTPCVVNAVNLPIYYSQIGFQGVKRFNPSQAGGYSPGSPAPPPPFDPSKFILRPYTYTTTLNLNWFAWTTAGLPQIARTFTIEIQDYDFELHQITAINTATGLPIASELFQIQLYDATAKRALSSSPVNARYILANSTLQPVFPVPPLVYPVWTQIRFDISSLVCNQDVAAPYSIQLAFTGVNRTPRVQSSPSATENVIVGVPA